ncbi:MAG: class I SAM-dependent methyltransferase [Gammaproteobacteria bacterium]
MPKKNCPVCGGSDILATTQIEDMPIYCNVLHDTYEQAINAPKGDIKLGFCQSCGHIYNYAFDASLMDYTVEYENSLHYSKRFNEYAKQLAKRLVSKFELYNKNILEIGCGKGDFLEMLCSEGNNTGYGFDKSYDPNRVNQDAYPHITFIKDFYSEKYRDYNADLVCCRHVLEHIEQPSGFLSQLRKAIEFNNDKAAIYFEVPNALFTFEDLGIWDLIYEHCSYFTPQSLITAFTKSDYKILEISEAFGCQFLSLEATIKDSNEYGQVTEEPLTSKFKDLKALRETVAAFDDKYQSAITLWRNKLMSFRHHNEQRIVVWGGGSKGVTFLNAMSANDKIIKYIVDVNPHKQNKFVPGTGQKVISPVFLLEYKPDYILIMNAIYHNEIANMLNEINVQANIICV